MLSIKFEPRQARVGSVMPPSKPMKGITGV